MPCDEETDLASVRKTHRAVVVHEAQLTGGLPHDDPADRFLAATAKFLDLTLVTADERLLGCRGIKTLRA